MAPVDKFLAIMLIASVVFAALAYWHARKIHWRIEDISPGFNDRMRASKKDAPADS